MSEQSAGQEAYAMASEIVKLLNQAIDEETDPEKRAALKRALEHAHGGEDHIAQALEAGARAELSRELSPDNP
jgi:hypothetical protein